MAVLDFIFNCVSLLLWLNWRSRRLSPPEHAPAIALIGTLKRAGPSRPDRWSSLITLSIVLLARAVAYYEFGPMLHWTPKISLGALPIVLHFRSDLFTRMLLYSWLGFLGFVATFYFSLLLVAAVNRSVPNTDPWQAMVRMHLGILSRLPAWLMLLFPFCVTFVLWIAVGPLLAAWGMQLPAKSFKQLVEQAALVAAGAWLLWQYVIAVALGLHIISSYVFLGRAPIWNFVNTTARNFLRPLAWLPTRIGRIDLLPLLALGLLVGTVIMASQVLASLYSKLSR